jgi:hypothetical protein
MLETLSLAFMVLAILAAAATAAWMAIENSRETVILKHMHSALLQACSWDNYWQLTGPLANNCFNLEVRGSVFASLMLVGGAYTVRGFGADDNGGRVIYQKTYESLDEAVAASIDCCRKWSELEYSAQRRQIKLTQPALSDASGVQRDDIRNVPS